MISPTIIPEWLSLKLAAIYTNSSVKTVSRWIKSGEIKYTKLPSGTIKIRRAYLNDYMEKYTVEPVDLDMTVKELLNGIIEPKSSYSKKINRKES